MPRPEAFFHSEIYRIMFKDSHTGKDSVSKTLFVISSVVVFVKVLTSGVIFGDFSGAAVDFIGLAAVHAVFASAYYGRSKVKSELSAKSS